MTKMLLDLQQGLIEVEGEESFVSKVYTDIKEILLEGITNYSRNSSARFDNGAPSRVDGEMQEPNGDPAEVKKSRKRVKGSGPSCPSRIDALKVEGYFQDLRTSKEICDKLREKGTAYEGKRVAAALLNLTSSGKLRRLQEGGVWKYQNP